MENRISFLEQKSGFRSTSLHRTEPDVEEYNYRLSNGYTSVKKASPITVSLKHQRFLEKLCIAASETDASNILYDSIFSA